MRVLILMGHAWPLKRFFIWSGGLFLIILMILGYINYRKLHHSPAYQEALRFLETSPVIQEMTGGIEKVGIPQGKERPNGTASYRFFIKGKNDNIEVVIELVAVESGHWEVTYFEPK